MGIEGITAQQAPESAPQTSEPTPTMPTIPVRGQTQFSALEQENSFEQDAFANKQQESGKSAEQEIEQKQEEPKEDPYLSKQLAYLAKKERAILERERLLKEREPEQQQVDEGYEAYKKALELRDHDPLSVLESLGLTYEQLQNHYTNDENPMSKREAILQKKIDDLEKWRVEQIESKKKQEEEQLTTQKKQKYETQVKKFMGDLKEIAENKKDEQGNEVYELVKQENAYELVYEYCNQFYAKTGKVVSHEEALQAVENHLEKEFAKQIEKRLQYKKLGKYGQVKKQEDDNPNDFFTQSQRQQPYQNNTPPQTLTNNFAPVTPPRNDRAMTIEESKRKAAELIEFYDD